MENYEKEGHYKTVLFDAKTTEMVIRAVLEQQKISIFQLHRFKRFIGDYKMNMDWFLSDIVGNNLYISNNDDQLNQTTPSVKKYEENQAFLKETFQEVVLTSEHVEEFYEKVPEGIGLLYASKEKGKLKELAEQEKLDAIRRISDMKNDNLSVQGKIEEYEEKGQTQIEKIQRNSFEQQN